LLQRVVGSVGEGKTNWKPVPQGLDDACPLEERKFFDSVRSFRSWWPPQTVERCSEEAIPGLQMVIQKAEGSVSSERSQPERQTSQLYSHWVQVDAEEATLGNRSPDRAALAGREVARMMSPGRDEGPFVGACQVFTRGDEERAAAHGRVQNLQLKDAFGRPITYEWRQGAAHEILRKWQGRIEGSGGFSQA
jgi:hypothetical protein